jgi:hypothetical protein
VITFRVIASPDLSGQRKNDVSLRYLTNELLDSIGGCDIINGGS